MRRWWIPIPLVLIALLSVTLAVPALASPPVEGAAGGHGQEAKPGLMDIDPASVIVALLVFAVLLVVLAKSAWGPILKGLKAREETIQKAVDDAQAASVRAQEVMKEYEGRMARANEEAKAVLEEARRDALALKASIEADAKRTADENTARAVREIGQAKAAAWDALVRDAAKLSTEAASRIIKRSLDAQGHAALVDEVVAEVVASRKGGRA